MHTAVHNLLTIASSVVWDFEDIAWDVELILLFHTSIILPSKTNFDSSEEMDCVLCGLLTLFSSLVQIELHVFDFVRKMWHDTAASFSNVLKTSVALRIHEKLFSFSIVLNFVVETCSSWFSYRLAFFWIAATPAYRIEIDVSRKDLKCPKL